MSSERVTLATIERLTRSVTAPALVDAQLTAQLSALSTQMQTMQRAIEQTHEPFRKLGAQLAALAELEPRRRRLIGRLGSRHAHVARGILRLSTRDARQLLDAIEHGSEVDARLRPLLGLLRDALIGRTVSRAQLRRATRHAAGAERRPLRYVPDRRGDQRRRIDAGCTSRPRAPGSGSTQLRATAAPARPIPIPRGSPV